MAQSSTIDLRYIKALSKENRQWLASEIRKDPDLWNAVNGVGGLSQQSHESRLQGTVINNGKASIGVEVSIIDNLSNNESITTTNQNGYYLINLKPGSYTVILKNSSTTRSLGNGVLVKTVKGVTSTLNFPVSNTYAKDISDEIL